MKERLTGAIILVAVIVLLAPALLTGPLRPAAHSTAGTTAPASEPPLRTYTIDLADNTRAGETAVRSPAPTLAAPLPKAPQPAPPAPAPASRAAPPAAAHAVTPKPAAAAGTPAGAAGEGWMVQLGSFAHRANAEHLAQQLRARGFQVGVSRATKGRRLYRVRAGPVGNRAEAEQLAAKLQATGHRGAIVPK